MLYAGQRKVAGSVWPEHGVRRKEVSVRGPKAQGQLCTPLSRRWRCEQAVKGERGEGQGRLRKAGKGPAAMQARLSKVRTQGVAV